MSDAALAVKYYTYEPPDLPAGVYQTPFAGEVCTGEVICVRADQASALDADPAFKKASQKDYDKQLSHADQVAELQKPYAGEEE